MKRWGILLLTLCLAAALFSVQVFASETEIVTGTCGSTANWSLDTQTGVLTISGTGTVLTGGASYKIQYPWEKYNGMIDRIVVEEGITDICMFAFWSFDQVELPSTVTSVSGSALHNAKEVIVAEGNPCYKTIDGVLYQCDENGVPTLLVHYPKGRQETEFVIPDHVTAIDGYAFSCVSNLVSVFIPDSVTSMGINCFQSCDSLKSVRLSANANLRFMSFYYCGALEELIIPEGVTGIEYQALYNCGKLSHVVVPSTVTSIGSWAMDGRSTASHVYFMGNAPAVTGAGSNSASFDADQTTLYYREGTTGWTDSAAYNAEKGTWNGYLLKTWEPMEPAVLTISSETVNPGKTATLTVSISGNPGLAGYRFELLADPAVITLSNAQCTGVSENAMTFQYNATENGLVLVCLYYEEVDGDGALFTVQATVAEDAPEGVYAVELVCNPLDIVDETATPIPVEKENGRVAVTNYSKGDLTGEGKVSNADLIRLSRSVLGMTELNLGQSLAADVNGDGKITNADTIRLARSLLGLVEL